MKEKETKGNMLHASQEHMPSIHTYTRAHTLHTPSSTQALPHRRQADRAGHTSVFVQLFCTGSRSPRESRISPRRMQNAELLYASDTHRTLASTHSYRAMHVCRALFSRVSPELDVLLRYGTSGTNGEKVKSNKVKKSYQYERPKTELNRTERGCICESCM